VDTIYKHALAWTVLLAFAAACDSAERPAPPSEPTTLATMHLDFAHPTATLAITDPGAARAKFVQVRVTHVENPARVALSFAVAYQTSNGDKIALGFFSLYPADNPGTFIVPTQGKIRADGSIVVTLESPDQHQRVAVTIGEIRLIVDAS
jgi:hypothetical protein